MFLFWIEKFSEFFWKNPCKKKRFANFFFYKREKSQTCLKIIRKKHKNLKVIWAVLGHSKPNIFSVGQLWCPTFCKDLDSPNYFSTALMFHLLPFSKFTELLLYVQLSLLRNIFCVYLLITKFKEVCSYITYNSISMYQEYWK